MINDKKILSVIPARGGSKGLLKKNIKQLAGKPLVQWPIDAANNSSYIDRVIVSTDDIEIAEIAKNCGAELPFMRPSHLAEDTSSTYSVIEHAINQLKKNNEDFDYIILLEPTSPLTTHKDIDNAIKTLDRKSDVADSIVGVSKVESTHPIFDVIINEKGFCEPYLGKQLHNVRRQDIDEVFFHDGTLYISKLKQYLENKTFYNKNTLPYLTPKWKSFEVDDIVDFLCIEAILNNIDLINEEK
jgi:N-acylneuraminate cytidylyltransferase/CMP-N,N'-diacetyllegionaminic acid synthase